MRCPTAWGSVPGLTTKTRVEAAAAVAPGVAPDGTEAALGRLTEPQATPRGVSDARSIRPARTPCFMG
jgi:hypothetical protein